MKTKIIILLMLLTSSAAAEEPIDWELRPDWLLIYRGPVPDDQKVCIVKPVNDYIVLNCNCLILVRIRRQAEIATQKVIQELLKLRRRRQMQLEHDHLYRGTGDVLL